MNASNRQWLLRRRPSGAVVPDDFEYAEATLPCFADLAPGELVLRNRVLLCAPTMRNWMGQPGNHLYPTLALGEPVCAPAACEVIASARPGVLPGMRVRTLGSWQDYQRVGAGHRVTPIEEDLNLIEAMGVLGTNTLAAYFGMLRVGRPAPGDTVVVSGAAGSTGSMAAQIAKLAGCRVIGIAGGAKKCEWLTQSLGLDGAVDYKREAVEARLRKLCPSGIDVFFDNVGGCILRAAVEVMARKGRIVLCGQISGYNDSTPMPGLQHMMRLIYGSITMQGFLQGDYAEEAPAALHVLRGWLRDGNLKARVDARPGFARIPETFASLFDGSNEGTLLAVIEE